MDNDFFRRVLKSKSDLRKTRARLPFEEKIKILIELQKIGVEMNKNSKSAKKRVWQL